MKSLIVSIGMLTALAASALGQATLTLKDGSQQQAESVTYRESSRVYVLLIDPSRGLQAQRSARDVVDVRVPEPPQWAQARQLGANPRTLAQAIPLLEEIVDSNIGLRWDIAAGEMLARAYLEAGRTKDATRICQRIMRAAKPQWVTVGLHRVYMDSLVAAKNFQAVERSVGEMLRSGHAPTMALAYLVRGDALAASGKLEEAVLDGYLRSIVLFPTVHSIRPEALARGANALEKLRDPRSSRLRQMLLDQYPNSPQARGGGR